MLRKDNDGPVSSTEFFEERPRHPIRRFVQLIVGYEPVIYFYRDTVRVSSRNLLEALGDRSFDVLLREFNKAPRRVKTSGPYRFLFRRQIHPASPRVIRHIFATPCIQPSRTGAFIRF